jgi:O-antigen/teichoic acid export membrane protein
MNNDKEEDRKIFRSISLFGGIQIIQVIISIIRSKIVAILLGPSGIGMLSLFLSTTNIISTFSGLGLNFSAVRQISLANNQNDASSLNRVVNVFKRWMYFTAILGLFITLTFSRQLSFYTFGNYVHTSSFVILSISLIFTALYNRNIAVLQGMQKLKHLAYSAVLGSGISLTLSIPFFYFMGEQGIVISILSGSIITYITSTIFIKWKNFKSSLISFSSLYHEGKDSVKLGMIMMISSLIGTLVTFLVNIYIRKSGGINDVGLYQAGITLTTQYIGLIFTSMSMDYFPRLSSVSENNDQVKNLVNKQLNIIFLIASPLIILLIILAPFIINTLFSNEFNSIVTFVRIVCLGLLFKTASFPIGYISFAKGDKKTFFIFDALLGNVMTITFNIILYKYFGLNGLGVSFLLVFLIYFFVITYITKIKYSFNIDNLFYFNFFKILIIATLSFGITFFSISIYSILAQLIIITYISFRSYSDLNRIIDFRIYFNKYKR